VIPQEICEFISRYVKSVWALETLLFLRQHVSQSWTVDQLQAELRASRSVVNGVLPQMIADGLVVAGEDERYRFNAAAAAAETVAELDRLYRERPVSVIREIALAPHRRIQNLADAFRFRKD
jgi:hypothetical protein